jgi:hypothetical protein
MPLRLLGVPFPLKMPVARMVVGPSPSSRPLHRQIDPEPLDHVCREIDLPGLLVEVKSSTGENASC